MVSRKGEIVPYSEFYPVIVLFFAEIGPFVSNQGHSFKPELPVLKPFVQKFGRDGKTSVIEVHDRGEGGCKVKYIERFFLTDPQVKVVFPWIHSSIVALKQGLGLYELIFIPSGFECIKGPVCE